MTDQDIAPAGPGHNNPPPTPREALELRRERIEKLAARWLADEDRKVIRDKELAKKLTDFINLHKDLLKDAEALRKEEKAPVLKIQREIDGYFKEFPTPLSAGVEVLTKRRTEFLQWEKAEAEKVRLEAERKQREAEAAAEAARKKAEEEQSLAALQAAEAAEAERKATKKVASKAKAAVGQGIKGELSERATGLRRVKTGHIEDFTAALTHWKDHPSILAAVQDLANQAARAVPMSSAKSGLELAPGVLLVVTETS
jgi:hypothetical protein